jgi:hypothetical protein
MRLRGRGGCAPRAAISGWRERRRECPLLVNRFCTRSADIDIDHHGGGDGGGVMILLDQSDRIGSNRVHAAVGRAGRPREAQQKRRIDSPPPPLTLRPNKSGSESPSFQARSLSHHTQPRSLYLFLLLSFLLFLFLSWLLGRLVGGLMWLSLREERSNQAKGQAA